MPTASSAHIGRVTRSARITATTRPISASAGIVTRPPLSLVTGVVEPVNTEMPEIPEEIEPSRRSRSAPSSPPFRTRQEENASNLDDPLADKPILPHGVAFADLAGMFQTLSDEVHRLRGEVDFLKTREESLQEALLSSNEAVAGLRSSLQSLEEIVFRELVADDAPVEKLPPARVREQQKKKKKIKTPNRADTSRPKSKKPAEASDESSTEAEETSDEEESTSIEVLGPDVPGLTEQATRRPEFKNLVSYRAYRLADMSQTAGTVMSGKIYSHLKRLRHYVDYKFTGDPAIQMLDFLKSFKEAADINEVSEAAAAVSLPYFLDGRAKSGLSSRMKQIPASMPKFPAAVQWLLQSYATEAVIAASYQKVFTARQSGDEDEKQFATRLTKYAPEAGGVFTEDALISAYVDGLQTFASNMVRGQVTPTMTFAEVQLLAEQAGTASRALSASTRVTSRGNPGVTLMRRSTPAAFAEYPRPGTDSYSDQSHSFPHSGDLVAMTDKPRDTEIQSEAPRAPSPPSSISAPSREWISAASSFNADPTLREATLAAEYRNRSCHLCFNPYQFLMDCPLLGNDVRQLAQRQREQTAAGPRRESSYGKPQARPTYPPRVTEPRSPPLAVNSVLEDDTPRKAPPSPTWSEN